jgi:hypothetical protein
VELVVSTVAATVTKARSLLAFVGILSLLGLDWSTWDRVLVGLALVAAVAIESSADGHRIWGRTLRSVPTQHRPTA